MGDRKNPIKFGPEWLRNLPQEQAATRTSNQNTSSPSSSRPTGSQRPSGSTSSTSTPQSATGSVASPPPTRSTGTIKRTGGTGSGNAAGGTPGSSGASPGNVTSNATSGTNTRNPNTTAPRVTLARLRYGREEMLALYDRNVEAPDDLKHFDVLYQSRGKPPAALNNYEDETRDNARGGPPGGPSGDRYAMSRGLNRGSASEPRANNKTRSPFSRHTSAGRGQSLVTGTPRLPIFSGGEDEPTSSRTWSASNGAGVQNRTPTEQTDWSKMFRRRQNNNTNWRQPSTREEEEWRQENPRSARSNADKWDRDWGDRPNQDRPQGWSANRRSRGGDAQNDDNLPEWAVDNTEGGGAGTFDSSGAFHGCSADDTNPPRAPEPFALTRSQTHGNIHPTSEEGSDEWWASEKAKKLSPKRFEAGDVRFKRSKSANANDSTISSSSQNEDQPEIGENVNAICEASSTTDDKNNGKNKFSDTQKFDALLRQELDYDDKDKDNGNFQSVMITPNNGLRQKHQNMVSSATKDQNRVVHNAIHAIPQPDNTSTQTPEEHIMEKFLELPMENATITMSNIQPQSSATTGITSTINIPTSNIQMMMNQSVPNHGIPLNNSPHGPAPIQNVGVQNSALNSSLGLPIGTGNNGIGIHDLLPQNMQNPQMNISIGTSMQTTRSIIGGFHMNNGMSVIQGPNVANSLFMNQNNAQQQMASSNEIASMAHNSIYPMMNMQHTNAPVPYRPLYGNTMPSNGPNVPSNNLAEQWFYEDPNKIIQGPFTSHDMYNWYRAGFFNSSLMVRRGCDAHLRPLGSYGPIVPFINMEMMSPFAMAGFDSRPPANREIINQPATLGIDETLWSQPSSSRDTVWMQPPVNNRNEAAVNNLPLFFWEQQPSSAISSNSLLPEEIAKEMKTEDQILAQLRASQNISTPQQPAAPFITDIPASSTSIIKTEDFANAVKAAPDLEELQKLIQNESLLSAPPSVMPADVKPEVPEPEVKEKSSKSKISSGINDTSKQQSQSQNKVNAETKSTKQAKNETEKANKTKENNVTKTKNKKSKEEKKEDITEVKNKEDENKVEKRSADSSPSKSKKEEKQNKKDIEREKKEWVKEGFTIVKGPEKNLMKENKKKVEEAKIAEETERKKKEEEKLAAEDEKKRKLLETMKKQQQEQQQIQQKPLESFIKKAPWSAVATHAVTTNKDGPTLAEIQRLEREKKLEQIKEQQQMMNIIAQQQAAAVAREQEMQAVVGWAKKKSSNNNQGQSLAEIQAETKRQSAAAAAAAAAAQAIEEAQAITVQMSVNHVPWGNTHNGGGFWDTQPAPPAPAPKPEKPQEPVKPAEPSKKKKVAVSVAVNKKETSPMVEFEAWCNGALASWSYKIDVPTFIGFLKDIESPYEVKDYIKCYLDESKDSNDFARQFLERRSKLLRVGTVTPSDDLCSPAMAINPRNTSGSDYQEVKGKTKKTKKNKMLKVDARILGFSVTASEDRINVGDIDTV